MLASYGNIDTIPIPYLSSTERVFLCRSLWWSRCFRCLFGWAPWRMATSVSHIIRPGTENKLSQTKSRRLANQLSYCSLPFENHQCPHRGQSHVLFVDSKLDKWWIPSLFLGDLKNVFYAIAFGVVILLKHESILYALFILLGPKFFVRMDIYSIWFIIPSMKFKFPTPPACFTVFAVYLVSIS